MFPQIVRTQSNREGENERGEAKKEKQKTRGKGMSVDRAW